MRQFYPFILPLFLFGCGVAINTQIFVKRPVLNFDEHVEVFETFEDAPDAAVLVGKSSIGDSGFSTNCNYEVVLQKAKEEARKAGGNAIKITEHKKPDILSSCHRIKFNILFIE